MYHHRNVLTYYIDEFYSDRNIDLVTFIYIWKVTLKFRIFYNICRKLAIYNFISDKIALEKYLFIFLKLQLLKVLVMYIFLDY